MIAGNPRAVAAMLDVIYPVGSIIEWAPVSGKSVDLSTAEKVGACYGGTWEAYGTNQFLLGASQENAVGTQGGESTVTLTKTECPPVAGSFSFHGPSVLGTQLAATTGCFSAANTVSGKYLPGGSGTGASSIGMVMFENGGGGQPHNNMPPYITVYRWRRIA